MCPYFLTIDLKQRPQYAQLWDVNMKREYVESQFGQVVKGSILSYQQKLCKTDCDCYCTIENMLSPPSLVYPDLSSFVMGQFPLMEKRAHFYDTLHVSDIQSRDYEELTRLQADNEEWHKLRSSRLTASKFKRICARKADFNKLAKDLLTTRNVQTAAMKYGIEHEATTAETYAKEFGRNIYRVGFVINPTCVFLGCSPDRRVLDMSNVDMPWGLLEIKCSTAYSLFECKFLHVNKETNKLQLRKSHDYYYQIMGQMGITGHSWCDLFVSTQTEYHMERIYFDAEFFAVMMQKLCSFYFVNFLHVCTAGV
jgi:hypothetical protein